MVWCLSLLDEDNLSLDLLDHLLGSISNSLHGQGREPVWEHGSEEKSSEGEWLKDVYIEDVLWLEASSESGSTISHGRDSNIDTCNKGSKESKSNKASRSNGESLSNSSGGVTSGIKSVSVVSDSFVKVAHLSNTSSIVRDWTISIDGKSNWEASKHSNGSKGNSIHGSPLEGNKNGDSEADDWDDGGFVSKGKSNDDIWSWARLTCLSKFTDWGVLVGGIVFSDESNEESGPESKKDASIGLPWGSLISLVGKVKVKVLWEHIDGWNDHDRE